MCVHLWHLLLRLILSFIIPTAGVYITRNLACCQAMV